MRNQQCEEEARALHNHSKSLRLATQLEVTAKARKPYQPGIMGRWITSLSRRPLRLHTFIADSQRSALCEDSNCCPRFQAWGVFTNASNDSIHFSSIVSSCTALTLLEFSFRPFFLVNSDWFRFPAAIPSSSGPKYSQNRVISDGHVVRVLLAHQECLLYGRVHWAGADLQIRGLLGGGGGWFHWIRHWSKLLFLTQSCCFSPVLGSMVSIVHYTVIYK